MFVDDSSPTQCIVWKDIASLKQRCREESIKEWRANVAPPSGPTINKSKLLNDTLTERECSFTLKAPSAAWLVKELSEGKCTSVEVMKAFIKASVVAQDATNCLTEICFDEALRRAEYLDQEIKRTGKPIGCLHGLPVSIKDHIDVKGMDSSSGFIGWCNKKRAEKDAVIVQCLREAGAIVFCKTSNPQSLLAIETDNNVWGRTCSAHNKDLSAGGSSGGEGALIGMRGSLMGVGTDIAGSIRIPALWNGIYGLRPSVGRLPHSGLQGPHDGMDMIMGVVGPLATCVEDLSLFCSAVLAQQPWLLEAQNICKPWEAIKSRNPLTIGVMYDDGLCAPHPPISGALEEAVKRLRACGHKIVVWDPISAKESEEILFTSLLQDQGEEYREHLSSGNEPAVPVLEWLLTEKIPSQPVNAAHQQWKLAKQRENLRQRATEKRNSLGVDVILCPGAPTLAPRHNKSRHWGYTSMWNVLDWPAVTFPVEPGTKSASWPPHPPRSVTEEHVFSEWIPSLYDSAPIGLQLVGRRLEEEKLLEDLVLIETCLSRTA